MSLFETAFLTQPYQQRCEDLVAVHSTDDRVVIVVADGAGGSGDGLQAATAVIRETESAIATAHSAERWRAVLAQVDCRLGSGESTAVVVDVRSQSLCGASVGDSQAWLINDEQILNLTNEQHRKPLLGSGLAQPIGFHCDGWNGLLIVATDGFCNYVNRSKLTRELPYIPLAELPRKLVEMVRLRSGDLWDDIGLVVCRRARPSRRMRRFAISADE